MKKQDTLQALETSATLSLNHSTIHNTLKVTFTAAKGKIFSYYEMVDGWEEVSKERALQLITTKK